MNENDTPTTGGVVSEIVPSPALIDGCVGLVAHEILLDARNRDESDLAQLPGGPNSDGFDLALSLKMDAQRVAAEAHVEALRHGR